MLLLALCISVSFAFSVGQMQPYVRNLHFLAMSAELLLVSKATVERLWVCRTLCLTLRQCLQVGAGFWLRDPGAVRQHAEALAKARFADTKDPTSCALFYAALGRKSLLQVSCQDSSTLSGG